MEYIGKLYGKIGKKYFYLGKTSEDFDLLEKDKSTYFAKQLDIAMTKIKELEFEAMEYRADLQDLENENKDLSNKNESQAMRIGMYKCIDDEIDKYIEDIESLQKEKFYMNCVKDEFADEVDKLRLGVCHIKEMLEENKWDAVKCLEIIERILAPTNSIFI